MRKLVIDQLDFKKGQGLLPAIVQDADTRCVLMLGYMNQEAVEQTLASGWVTFYSRSRQTLWVKGETSGNRLRLEAVHPDCDQDTLLVLARPTGPVCHLGDATCFQETDEPPFSLKTLEAIITARTNESPESSYTRRLLDKGIAKIAQKVGEEAVETVIEAVADRQDRFEEETADLLYHLLVLLKARNTKLGVIEGILN